jgi:hypothetical protein
MAIGFDKLRELLGFPPRLPVLTRKKIRLMRQQQDENEREFLRALASIRRAQVAERMGFPNLPIYAPFFHGGSVTREQVDELNRAAGAAP